MPAYARLLFSQNVFPPGGHHPAPRPAAVPDSIDGRAWIGVAAGAIATAAVDVATIVAEVGAATIGIGAGAA